MGCQPPPTPTVFPRSPIARFATPLARSPSCRHWWSRLALHLLQDNSDHLIAYPGRLWEPWREVPLGAFESSLIGGEIAEGNGFGPSL